MCCYGQVLRRDDGRVLRRDDGLNSVLRRALEFEAESKACLEKGGQKANVGFE